jgi:hypothetical protein
MLVLQVWQLQQGGRLDRLRSLGRFAAGVHCVAPAAGRPWLLAASLDGFVVAWSTDSWQQLFRWGEWQWYVRQDCSRAAMFLGV